MYVPSKKTWAANKSQNTEKATKDKWAEGMHIMTEKVDKKPSKTWYMVMEISTDTALYDTPFQLNGVRVSRTVARLLKTSRDSEGTNERKTHKLKQTTYRNPGLNCAWHCDGYATLKPYGLLIVGVERSSGCT